MGSFETTDGPRSDAAALPVNVSVRGRHIFVQRNGYTHHGVDYGDGTAIEFGGLDSGKAAGSVRRIDLAGFAQGAPIRVRRYGRCGEADVVIARAESMLGTPGYDLFANNCEHFATWCMTGSHHSAQVQAAVSTVGAAVSCHVAPRLAENVVIGLGQPAPASAANIMSGLKAAGGSPAGGVGTVTALGAVVGAGIMCVALRDKPYLTEQERTGRRVGRAAAAGGGVVAAGGVVYAVGALGVSGFGAAGISSGLTALTGGGGMLAGVAAAAAIPLAIAILLGLLGYALVDLFAGADHKPRLSL